MTPPLRVWGTAAVVVLGVILYLWLFFIGKDSPSTQTAVHYRAKIKELHSTGKDTVTVVILGSSLALNAFGGAPQVAVNCRPTKILYLTVNMLTLQRVQEFGILESLSDFPPHYLFFESNLLMLLRKEVSHFRFIWDYNIIYLRHDPLALIRLDKSVMDQNIDKMGGYIPELHLNNKRDTVLWELRSKKQYNMVENEASVVDKSFQKLIRKNCKIVLLRYPVVETPSYKNRVPALLKKVEKYQKADGIVSWEIPRDRIQDRLFYDGAHMNRLGSSVFVPWFSSQLNQELCNY